LPGRTHEAVGRFRSAGLAARFTAAYDAVLSRWPAEVTTLDAEGSYGVTRVHACGPPGAPPLILLHGGNSTSAVWFASAGPLSRAHRVYAPDQIGAPGRSMLSGRPPRTPADLLRWLDELLTALGLDSAALCGHSYGGWLALSYALHAPQRVSKLALLDPTSCFSSWRLGYLAHAAPLLARPAQARARRFLAWETGGIALDPRWLELAVLAGRGAEPIPQLSTAVLPGATHHSLPTHPAGQLNDALLAFLAG